LKIGPGETILNRMVEDLVAMDAVFHALAHEARRGMVARLSAGPLTVGQLAAPLAMSLAAAAKHVQVLERAGLVQRVVDGADGRWNERLDALQDMFRADPGDDSQSKEQ
jgi:DNA-binding transcriptional ArsR family regulator